jgi:hypothetical protein
MLFRSALLAAGLTVICAGAASAQMSETMKFTTTFPFTVGHVTLPAGAYTVTPLETDHALMQLRSGRRAVLVLTEPNTPKRPPKQDEVIFTRDGDTYVLREFWDAASVSGAEPIENHLGPAPKVR